MAHSEMKSLSAEVGRSAMQDYELSQIQECMKPAAGTIKHSVTRFIAMLSVSSVHASASSFPEENQLLAFFPFLALSMISSLLVPPLPKHL